MQVAKIPVQICNEVERLQRNFIWGSSDNGHGLHAIGWDRIIMPKDHGGLGFKRLSSMNRAFVAKLAWKLFLGPNNLWAEVLKHKYMMRSEDELLNVRWGDSKLWHFICQQRDIVEKGTCWQLRNVECINFFNDKWLFKERSIVDMCLRQLSLEDKGSKVADWVTDGIWDYSKLAALVNSDVMQRLITMFPPVQDAGSDIMIWNANATGIFTVKSAYLMLEKAPPNLFGKTFNAIRKWRGVGRIRTFLWLAFNNRLPTNAWRSSWAHTSPTCQYCDVGVEDVLHILRDCYYAKDLWLLLIEPRYASQFFSSSLRDWFALNLSRELGEFADSNWSSIWGVTVWKLWLWRNKFVFGTDFQKPFHPYYIILNTWESFAQVKIADRPQDDTRIASTVTGQPPPENWVKVNVDGAVSSTNSKAGCGGVIRNHSGSWILGFSKIVDQCSVMEAEEWGIY